MLLLIPAFRSLLSSGALLLPGAFFFATRKVSCFLGRAALVLSASLPASANAATQHAITFNHTALMMIDTWQSLYRRNLPPLPLLSASLSLDVFQKLKAGA